MSGLVHVLVILLPFLAASWDLGDYTCQACRHTLGVAHAAGAKFSDLCDKELGAKACSLFFSKDVLASTISRDDDFCFKHHMCPNNKELPHKDYAEYFTNSPNVHVTKALGSKGYNKVRVSLVTNSSISPSQFTLPNAYINQFKYKWTQFYLATAVVDVVPGEHTSVSVGGQDIKVFVPKENEGTVGIIIADPCFQSEWVTCKYEETWQMFTTLTSVLNAASSHPDLHYWQILGDNFYDQKGDATNTFFDALTLETKSRIMLATPGNHDSWVAGDPKLYTTKDQLQHGFFQYYGQDTVASLAAPLIPFDFSVNPTLPTTDAQSLPPASNLFTFNKVGNVVMIGFSGAHDYDAQKQYFEDACDFISANGADVVLVLGHWNVPGDGCASSAVPDVYKDIQSLPQCAAHASKFKYFEGHQHCNQVMEKDVGFMLGGMGMGTSAACGGVFGVPVVDTTGGRFRVLYFSIFGPDIEGTQNLQATISCFQDKGVSGCYDLPNVVVWADVPL